MTDTKESRPADGAGRLSQSLGGDKGQYTRFRCGCCGWVYESPIRIDKAWHACPDKGGAVRALKAVA